MKKGLFVVTAISIFCLNLFSPFEAQAAKTDSPFGIHEVRFYLPQEAALFADLGARAVRIYPVYSIIWDEIERKKGLYEWGYSDGLIESAAASGAELMVNIFIKNRAYGEGDGLGPVNPASVMPRNMEAYLNFLKAAAKRYKGKIDVYQIINEMDAPIFWTGTPEEYAYLLKESYNAIKSSDPGAEIAIGGISSPFNLPYYLRIFAELKRIQEPGEQYFDIFDFHWINMFLSASGYKTYYWPDGRSVGMREFINVVKSRLADIGYRNIRFYITEMTDYSGQPFDYVPKAYLEYRSEQGQAVSLLKRYVYAVASGVDKIFWSHIYERSDIMPHEKEGYFHYIGLLYDGRNQDDKGYGVKKLSYYTYKKMVDILEGSDWNNIQTIRESDGIYIYKFAKDNKPIWVAWNDNPEEKVATISGINSSQVKITEALPRYGAGKEVADYHTAFSSQVKEANEGRANIILKDTPVYIEEE